MATLIICDVCKAEHKLEDILQERSIKDDLLEVGLLCNCGTWTHSYFTDAELKAKSVKVAELLQVYQSDKTVQHWRRYATARDVYNRQFVALNRRWRRKFGMLVKDGSQNDNKPEA